ncbi:Alpha/Beta hydrolase protein [Phaeosphaeriaceae sp. PMI808]|nr:Alpha/Beta hydrolase protein [Phaeosphaeriaceae sp. PMI808]
MLRALSLAITAISCASGAPTLGRSTTDKLDVKLSVAEGILTAPIDGRIVLMFAPNSTNPLDDTDVTSSPNRIFGKNVCSFGPGDSVMLSGGSNSSTDTGVYGWPAVSLNDITAGTYQVQAFLNKYETVTRSDGSTVSVHFPCGDGAPNVDTFGSLATPAVEFRVLGETQTLELVFDNVAAVQAFAGKEIGGCNQGNYEDTENLKHIKIRSEKLSTFWGRDMYVGANVLLPAGYNANDSSTRYPVIYSQGHWPADQGAFRYPAANFSAAWNKGIISGSNTTAGRSTPKLILVTFRHEAPFYDDSYAVNTANLGPYGDALNDELLPYLESIFHTIRAPYARIQEGGSTGGSESAANLIFRPDLFGFCFSSYPDSLSFRRHQDIELYTAADAYIRSDGTYVPSIRKFQNGSEVVQATVQLENHWELTFGTSSRSSNQWDIWNAVFGVQGYKHYPLEPWDKDSGEIYPGAVKYWKQFDLAEYIVSNWNNSLNLGAVLAGRIHIYVGSWDNYYLNEGVVEFQKRTDSVGGSGWANMTVLPNKTHGGNYQAREIWDFLEFLEKWVQEHGPSGKKALGGEAVSDKSRGNKWEDVLRRGGRSAAVERQSRPVIVLRDNVQVGSYVRASVGRWDPGVQLRAQWVLDGEPENKLFDVDQDEVEYEVRERGELQLWVTGEKRGYKTETRGSECVIVG